jgi:5-methylcytosine-specific restriction endonuclease McrA
MVALPCLDCGRDFKSQQALGAHRWRSHGDHGPSTTERSRRWREANRKRHRELSTAWYWRNRETVLAKAARPEAREANHRRSRAWSAANRERVNAYHRGWKQRNREKVRLQKYLYWSRKRNAPGHTTIQGLRARIAYYGWRCWMCGAAWEEIDHVIPLVRGGSNWPANLRPACGRCNGRKWAHKPATARTA